MHALSRKRFERLAFAILIVASFYIGRRWTGASRAEAASAAANRAANTAGREPVLAADTVAGGRDAATPDTPSVTASGKVDRAKIYRQMIAALNEPISTERWLHLAGVLQGLSPDNWRGVLQALDDEQKLHGREHADARAFFVRRAGEVVGVDAITYFLEKKDFAAVRSAVTGWASKSPVEAMEWLTQQSDEAGRGKFLGDAIRGLAMAEPDLAIRFLEGVPAAERKKYTANFAATLVRTAGLERTQQLVDDMIGRARAGGTLKEPYLADIFGDLTAIKVRRAAVSGNVESAIGWLNQHIGQPYVSIPAVRTAADQLAKDDPLKAIEWLDSVNATKAFSYYQNPVGYGTTLNAWTAKAGFAPVASWLNSNTSHPNYDYMAGHFSAIAAAKDPKLADHFANSIKDTTKRTAALDYIQQTVASQNRRKK